MSGGRCARAQPAALALLIGVLAAPVAGSAADDVATWMSALHAGGMEPAEAAVAALASAGELAVPPLASLVATGTPLERRRACAALAGMSTSVFAAVTPLAVASADGDLDVRLAAVDGLARWADLRSDARDALLARLADSAASVRVRAAASLAASSEIAAVRVEPMLLAALGDESVGPRIGALDGLARLAERASGAAVAAVTAAIGDPVAPVRGAAVVTLAALRPREVATVATLCPRLGDPDPWVAMGTARALVSIDAASADCAATFLASQDRATARRAAWLLHAHAFREPAAAVALIAHLDDADEVVRGYARSAAWLTRSRAAWVPGGKQEGDD